VPSFDTMTRVSSDSALDETEYLMYIGLAFTIYFSAIELIEMSDIGRCAAAAMHEEGL